LGAGEGVFLLRLEQGHEPLNDLFECFVRLYAHYIRAGNRGVFKKIDASTINDELSAAERAPADFHKIFSSASNHDSVLLKRASRQTPHRARHTIATRAEKIARDKSFSEWNLLPTPPRERIVRVVTIKHPPAAFEGATSDSSMLGKMFDLPPQLAILMIAAGWMRSDTRSRVRRHQDAPPQYNRRERVDRRSTVAA
jgi:hypothetical protein